MQRSRERCCPSQSKKQKKTDRAMDVETLDELRFKAHKNACEKGFHDMVRSSRHWLVLALSEMFEAIEADRIGKHSITHGEFCELISRGEEFKFAFERYVKDSTEDEKKKVSRFVDNRVFEMMEDKFGTQIDNLNYYENGKRILERRHSIFVGVTILGWLCAVGLAVIAVVL